VFSDYTGELRTALGLRTTDRDNGDGALSNEGGTVTNAPLSFNIPCSATPGPEGGAGKKPLRALNPLDGPPSRR
jgi:hypothetical protein